MVKLEEKSTCLKITLSLKLPKGEVSLKPTGKLYEILLKTMENTAVMLQHLMIKSKKLFEFLLFISMNL